MSDLLTSLDKLFSRDEELYRVVPAVWQGSSPFPMEMNHWHAHTRKTRQRALKKKVVQEGRLDSVFLCPTVMQKMAEMKLKQPALFFYLN